MRPEGQRVIDMHFHVGLLGDSSPRLGALSDHFRRQPAYKVFLAYARLDAGNVSDATLRAATERVIDSCREVDQVVCLALDPVYDARTGERREDLSHMWVDNRYVLLLRRSLGDKVLLGASVHPYDPQFDRRLAECVDNGAVLLKWVPSAQAIDLADPRVGRALKRLARARAGKPLPLLLHVGAEYAIPPADPALSTNDFLSWSNWERFWNRLRGAAAKRTPDIAGAHANIRAALVEGATIIFAHCGFPYFASRPFGKWFEHSDYDMIRGYLEGNAGRPAGRSYADVSACCTPFRRSYFDDVRALPPEYVLFGSDFPTPVFELTASAGERVADLRAALDGDFTRVIVPADNLLDVNYRQLKHFFDAHPMFTNFAALIQG